MLSAQEILKKKRDACSLTEKEIEYFIKEHLKGSIPDYQVAALLMAIYLQGMNVDETHWLTKAMMNSGKVLDLSDISGVKVDKHSTGGVGDKVSLIVAPLLASLGFVIPMITGKALGHTGGTVNKLRAITGFRTNLSLCEFKNNLSKIGLSIIEATDEIVPADKSLYALRNATATIDSIPLIAASIMSKKLAEGVDVLVLDVKTGNGAFMKEQSKAKQLAKVLVEIGKRMNKRVAALITNMESPLGKSVGTGLEIQEAINVLKGVEKSYDLLEVVYGITRKILELTNIDGNPKAKIEDGTALIKLKELVQAQGGNLSRIEDSEYFSSTREITEIKSTQTGYIFSMNTHRIGLLANSLISDPFAGFVFNLKTGNKVRKGDLLATIYSSDKAEGIRIGDELLECYEIRDYPPVIEPMIIEVIE